MYRYYDPNPNGYGGEYGDCVIRAISKLFHCSWDEAFIQLSIQAYKMKRIMTDNITWGSYLKEHDYIKEILAETITIREFCKQFDEGKYALATGSHVVAAINGDYFDSWDSGNEPILYLWREKDE